MIICSSHSLVVGQISDEIYQGPLTNYVPVKSRIQVLRKITREEYLEAGRELYGDKFYEDEDLHRGFHFYYEISVD